MNERNHFKWIKPCLDWLIHYRCVNEEFMDAEPLSSTTFNSSNPLIRMDWLCLGRGKFGIVWKVHILENWQS